MDSSGSNHYRNRNLRRIQHDDMKDIGNKVSDELGTIGEKVTDEVKDQAIKAMAGEASEATYTDNEDGTYSIKSTNIELTGIPNSGEVR